MFELTFLIGVVWPLLQGVEVVASTGHILSECPMAVNELESLKLAILRQLELTDTSHLPWWFTKNPTFITTEEMELDLLGYPTLFELTFLIVVVWPLLLGVGRVPLGIVSKF